MGVKKIYSPMNFCPILSKLFNIKIILALHSNLPWIFFHLMPGNIIRNLLTRKLMEFSISACETLIVDSYFAKEEIANILKINFSLLYINSFFHLHLLFYSFLFLLLFNLINCFASDRINFTSGIDKS